MYHASLCMRRAALRYLLIENQYLEWLIYCISNALYDASVRGWRAALRCMLKYLPLYPIKKSSFFTLRYPVCHPNTLSFRVPLKITSYNCPHLGFVFLCYNIHTQLFILFAILYSSSLHHAGVGNLSWVLGLYNRSINTIQQCYVCIRKLRTILVPNFRTLFSFKAQRFLFLWLLFTPL